MEPINPSQTAFKTEIRLGVASAPHFVVPEFDASYFKILVALG